MSFLPEDRRSEGIFPKLALRENLTATTLSRFGRFGLVSRKKQAALMRGFIDELRIKASGPQQPIAELSGGNQQKVLLSRCLASRPKLLLLDDPTRGIDVGAKDEVHAVIRRLADEGLGVLVTSSEVEELLVICDRLVAISEGEISGELEITAATTSEEVLALLAGQSSERAAAAG
jgi:ribose transport system ATP-binding protein